MTENSSITYESAAALLLLLRDLYLLQYTYNTEASMASELPSLPNKTPITLSTPFQTLLPHEAEERSCAKLSDKDLEDLASRMRIAYGWDEPPRAFQLAGVQAQLEGRDVVIQAPTGAGKTAITAGPYLWPSSHGKITIMVSPLMVLEDEMVGCNLFLLNPY